MSKVVYLFQWNVSLVLLIKSRQLDCSYGHMCGRHVVLIRGWRAGSYHSLAPILSKVRWATFQSTVCVKYLKWWHFNPIHVTRLPIISHTKAKSVWFQRMSDPDAEPDKKQDCLGSCFPHLLQEKFCASKKGEVSKKVQNWMGILILPFF